MDWLHKYINEVARLNTNVDEVNRVHKYVDDVDRLNPNAGEVDRVHKSVDEVDRVHKYVDKLDQLNPNEEMNEWRLKKKVVWRKVISNFKLYSTQIKLYFH